jgi:hypothetical protein
MKKILLLGLLAVFSLQAPAQNTDAFFEELTNNYADRDGFSASMITSDMFDLYIKKKNIDEESAVYEALNNLDKIIVVSQTGFSADAWGLAAGVSAEDKPKDDSAAELHKTILEHYKTGNYTLLKTENRMGEDVKVYLKKNQEKIESLALLTNSSAATNLVELKGDIDLSTVAELSKALNLRGLENLYKINNSGAMYFGQNTNAYFPQERIEEMVARQKELVERQRFLSEEQREKLEERARAQADRQMQMAERYREMAERYQRQPIFLNYPGDSTVYYLNGKKVEAETIKEIDKTNIKSIEVNKSEKEGEKTIVRIKTKE